MSDGTAGGVIQGARSKVRYIKLGPGGAWAKHSIAQGEIHFGHHEIPHELALTHDKAAIAARRRELGHSAGKANDFAREVVDFYTLDADTIWITFSGGYLWWAHAAPAVIPSEASSTTGARFRRTIGPWRNTDKLGRELRESALSTRLTKVAAYRQTLCDVEAAEYLLRRIEGQDEPAIAEALELKGKLVACAADLIAGLHWRDFETLVDLLLARAGWTRSSPLGGTMKDADLVAEQAVTNERALVQVKSFASQATLDDYVERFEENGTFTRLIFVCHSPTNSLARPDRPDVTVWERSSLADATIRSGLFDWLVERAA